MSFRKKNLLLKSLFTIGLFLSPSIVNAEETNFDHHPHAENIEEQQINDKSISDQDSGLSLKMNNEQVDETKHNEIIEDVELPTEEDTYTNSTDTSVNKEKSKKESQDAKEQVVESKPNNEQDSLEKKDERTTVNKETHPSNDYNQEVKEEESELDKSPEKNNSFQELEPKEVSKDFEKEKSNLDQDTPKEHLDTFEGLETEGTEDSEVSEGYSETEEIKAETPESHKNEESFEDKEPDKIENIDSVKADEDELETVKSEVVESSSTEEAEKIKSSDGSKIISKDKPEEKVEDSSRNVGISTFSSSTQSASKTDIPSYAVPMSYTAKIVNPGYTIDTKPWGEEGYQSADVGTSTDYLGETVEVNYESKSGSYASITWDSNYLGWIDKRSFEGDPVYTYTTKILFPTYTVDSEPWGRKGYETLSSTEEYLNQDVQVVMKNDNHNYSLTVLNGQELGWIDNRSLSSEQKHYTAYITNPNYSIDTRPWGRTGYETVSSTHEQYGDNVEIIGSNSNGNYAYVINNQTQEDLGWVDKRAMTVPDSIYTGRVLYPDYDIRLTPEENSESNGSSYDHLGEIMTVIDEDDSQVFIINNTQGLGWVNKNSMIFEEPTNLSYVLFPGYSIDTLPWGEEGYKSAGNGTSTDHINQVVNVIASADAREYSFITGIDGQSLGWVDNKALSINQSNELVNILYPGYSLDTRPWGEPGYQPTENGSSSDHFNKEVIAISQSTDGNYTFAVEKDGTPLGWIDQKAFGELIPVETATLVIENSGYSIDTKPWGTPGYEKVAVSNDYLGYTVDVLGENPEETYYLIALSGGILGWIDQDAMDGKPLIYIDPGHGGSDPGAVHSGVKEKDLNLAVGTRLANLLNSSGNYEVVMSREGDYFVSLDGRTDEANALGTDLFVSIHFNSMGGSGAARGIETFIHHTVASGFGQETNRNNFRTERPRIRASLEAADAIHAELIQDTGLRDRGVKGNNFHVLRETEMPAVLLELGFLDNYTERNYVNRNSYFNTAARAIKKGIDTYFSYV